MEFSVLVTFDLAYCGSSDYLLVKRKLEDMGFTAKSHRSGLTLPSNTYLAKIEEQCDGSVSEMLTVANMVVYRVYNSIKATTTDAFIASKVYVIASPMTVTTDSCSIDIK
ncbi:hypothetical protein QP597_08845 [Providencia stuartii]|uniref:hypothetical protein n=1 Tax=Providencia stuartii TaxID=588 RepID=UPI002882B601|nr:hypothetical protein [Providencia stuartii]MDK7736507.1 hypothetical protein [Providencia stuartii]